MTMQTVGPSGFYNVPATKFLIVSTGALSLLASIFDLKQYFHLQLTPHIIIHYQNDNMEHQNIRY
ncbi:hypothetical protein RO3G_08721 [Rhizopus delemar RA 99-880]|uniref:Uncharacterized protein n=1 Tax=Rhizopus delemar (strain RA 99-880 / ATCC MYA-4621 / FGSC 9543 / NRRL 43880) TaxID=246409 RepID=I1C6D6_RHIO9|nr:hypothetical protein RO3G_08721 [Rhizopus delemar RA 99-880]|eukprot:EIE84016.1 hypothetical protein RO3G_08721 [Rhizopus delemar RA 99-880]